VTQWQNIRQVCLAFIGELSDVTTSMRRVKLERKTFNASTSRLTAMVFNILLQELVSTIVLFNQNGGKEEVHSSTQLEQGGHGQK